MTQNKHHIINRLQYEKEGYLHIPSVITKYEASELKDSILRMLEIDLESKEGQDNFEKSNKYRRFALGLHMRLPTVAVFIRHPIFAQIASAIFGGNVDLHFTSTITKVKDKNASVDWHQDIIYDPTRDVEKLLCWAAITEANPENGGLYLIPGSHLTGILTHRPSDLYELDMQAVGALTNKAVPILMEAGDMLVIHPMLVHGSPENKSGFERVALMVGLQRPKAYSDSETKIKVEVLKNGKPVEVIK